MYRLFHEFANRYDLHTPPGHYRHDHAYVIGEALQVAPTNCRLLDIGCGTGVFLETAIAAGIDGYGIDASAEMIGVAKQRVGNDRVCVRRMQEISDENRYDVICALSWTIHYCESEADLNNVVARCRRALRRHGMLLLQVANDEQMTGAVDIERKRGPSGQPDDTLFVHRFLGLRDAEHRAIADYVYASRAYREILFEQHELVFANPTVIVGAVRRAGFQETTVVNSTLVSPFIIIR